MTDVIKCPTCHAVEVKSETAEIVRKIEAVCDAVGFDCVTPVSQAGSKEGFETSVGCLTTASIVVIYPDEQDQAALWWAGVAFARNKPILAYGESVALDIVAPVSHAIASHILDPEQLRLFLQNYKIAAEAEAKSAEEDKAQ